MSQATARHILVDNEALCLDLLEQLKAGAIFAELAMENSNCPSGEAGGDLGSFAPGMMVPEFDAVVFSADIAVPQGPVKTQFGWHIVEVTSRD
jgi:peptidyl-prolyl cis-trans isomerase C